MTSCTRHFGGRVRVAHGGRWSTAADGAEAEARESHPAAGFRFSLPLLRHVRSQERLFRAVFVRGASPRLRRRIVHLLAGTVRRELERIAPLPPTGARTWPAFREAPGPLPDRRERADPPDRAARTATAADQAAAGQAREAWAHTVAWAYVGVVSWWLEAGRGWSAEDVDRVFQRATGQATPTPGECAVGPDAPMGLESGRVRLVTWQPDWSRLFRQEARRIRACCGAGVAAVEHIGSTAVPGMPAKPILDLMAAVPTREAGLALLPALALLGYEHRPDPEIPERIYLRKRTAAGVTHHLSLAEPGSRFWRVQLCFRDHLLRNPEQAAAYAALKRSLAQAHPADRVAYTAGKTAFVLEVLERVGCG